MGFHQVVATIIAGLACNICMGLAQDDTPLTSEHLWQAARAGDTASLEKILASGVDVNAKTAYGGTALAFAAERGKLDAVKLLIEKGADVNAKDEFYHASPYTWASIGGHKEVAQWINDHGGKAAWDQNDLATPKAPDKIEPVTDPTALAENPELIAADQTFVSPTWPQFRGTAARGIADGLHCPLKWSVVANGTRKVRAYDARDGREIWSLGNNSEVVVPTPQFAYQTIFVTSGYKPIQPIYAVSMDARGDVTLPKDVLSSDAVRWSIPHYGPYLPTPIVYGGYLYTLQNHGVFSCIQTSTGKQIYRERIKGFGNTSFVASLVAADGHIFATSEDGQIIVIKAGPKFETLHSNPTGESILSTPAITTNTFVIRGHENLIAIRAPSADAKTQ